MGLKMKGEHIIPLDMAAEEFGTLEIEKLIKWIEKEVESYEYMGRYAENPLITKNKRLMFLVTRPYKKMLREISFSTKGRKSIASRRTFESNWEKICDMVFEAVESVWESV